MLLMLLKHLTLDKAKQKSLKIDLEIYIRVEEICTRSIAFFATDQRLGGGASEQVI